MHRKRLMGAGVLLAVSAMACQGGATDTGGVQGASGSPVLPSLPTSLPSGLESLLPSGAPSMELNQLFPVFQARGGADVTGGAIITDVEGEASVVVGVVAPGAAEALPIAIVEGDCASQTDPGPTPPAEMFPSPAPSGSAAAESPAAASPAASPSAPDASASPSAELPLWLTPVMAGSSNSVIPLAVDDLEAAPHAIVIETSPTDPTLIACADLVEGAPVPAPASPGASEAPGSSPEASPTSS